LDQLEYGFRRYHAETIFFTEEKNLHHRVFLDTPMVKEDKLIILFL